MKGRAFDLVICDLKMPRLDGQAFYAHRSSEAVPALARRVIFVTGDVAGTRGRAVPGESGLPLAREAVQAGATCCGPCAKGLSSAV